jgi:hypothetical protein
MAWVYGSVMLVSTAQTQAAVDYMWVCVCGTNKHIYVLVYKNEMVRSWLIVTSHTSTGEEWKDKIWQLRPKRVESNKIRVTSQKGVNKSAQ